MKRSKQPASRGKKDRRESSLPTDDFDSYYTLGNGTSSVNKRLKEKPSWRHSSKSTAGAFVNSSGNTEAGFWRPAICKLSEENNAGGSHGTANPTTNGNANPHSSPHGQCILTVYDAEDNTLQHVLHVHKLMATDIRPADKSLFFRTEVLGIHGNPCVSATVRLVR